MRESTDRLHNKLIDLGIVLGFSADREVSSSLLSLRLENSYQPRIDLLWSLPLDAAKRAAIAEVLECPLDTVTHLPIVGIEVEGTDPTTKTLMADAANLKSLGAPLGLIVTAEERSKGIYRRSVRAVRTVKQNLGEQSVIPIEASWVDEFLNTHWDKAASEVPPPLRKKPSGGESKSWELHWRKRLRDLGERAGFIVADPFTPALLEMRFHAELSRRSETMRHLWNPKTGETKVMQHYSDYLTECEIDMAWLLPLPSSLKQLLHMVAAKDPCLASYDILFPDAWSCVAVMGFELESTPGKHASGGLLNLAAYSIMGVVYSASETENQRMQGAVNTYTQALGLRNVFARAPK